MDDEAVEPLSNTDVRSDTIEDDGAEYDLSFTNDYAYYIEDTLWND